ncbi:MAG: hypothetical protein IJ011_10445 [Clostridia bacterium]|nr:hypothetical protein [Clostridia bacterium]
MNIIEKLENYFNSGSTDKQNKRRLGGLLIAITAILLVVSIVALSIGGVVAAIGGIVDAVKKPDEDPNAGINSHLAEVTVSDVQLAAAGNKLVFTNDEVTLTEADYTKLQRPNRPVATDGETKLYGCESADNFALQNEAFNAFNAMVTEFYNKEKLTNLWIKVAYNVTGGNTSYYANALAVKLDYVTDSETYTTASTYGVEDYEWIYEHAHEYGFVRVSNVDGEQNILRYVGLAAAKYIESKQSKNNDTFYGLDSFLAEIKATTPDNTMKISSVKKALGEKGTTAFYIYYLPATSEVAYRLPNNKYTYTVSGADDGGYIVTYRKADN